MANIQYADDGIYTVNFHADDNCGNRTTGTRTINVRERQFTISFDSKGGSVVQAILVNEGDDATNFGTPTKEDMAFKGWYDNPYCYGDPITIIEDVQTDYTLYAKWGEETYGTFLFGSGTHALVINCPESKKQEYIDTYGAVYAEYPAWSRTNEYDFAGDGNVYWATRRASITTLIIGSNISPNKMDYWFYGFDAIGSNNGSVIGLDKIDTSRCTSMKETLWGFHYRNKHIDLSSWDVRNVTNFYATLANVYASSLDVSTWVTSSATDMTWTFQNTQLTGTTPVIDMSTWDFSNVTTMYQMFAGSTMHTLNFGNPDTSNVTTFSQMFAMCAVTTIYSDDFDNSSETTTSSALFSGAANIVGGNGTVFDSSNINSSYAVVDMPGRPGYFTAPVTVKVTFVPNGGVADFDMIYNTRMLINLPTPTHPQGQTFLGWHYREDLADSAMTSETFYHSVTLYGEWSGEPSLIYHLQNGESDIVVPANDGDVITLDIRPEKAGMNFSGWTMDEQGWSTPVAQVTISGETHVYAKYLANTPDTHILFRDRDTGQYTLVLSIFDTNGCISVAQTIYGDVVKKYTNTVAGDDLWITDTTNKPLINKVEPWSTKCTISAYREAFKDCQQLHTVNLIGMEEWRLDPQTIHDMTSMFEGCTALTSIQWTSNRLFASFRANVSYFYKGCTALYGTVQAPPVTSVEASEGMFYGCTNIQEINFPASQAFGNCTTWKYMFYNCTTLETINFPDIYTRSLEDCESAFENCENLTAINNTEHMNLRGTLSGMSLKNMFKNCRRLPQLNWQGMGVDTYTIGDISYMFSGCESLEQVIVPYSFDLSHITGLAYKWSENCYRLAGSVIQWDSTMESDKSVANPSPTGLFRQAT